MSRRYSATYAPDRGWVIGCVPLQMGNTQFVLASDADHLEPELAQLRAERDLLMDALHAGYMLHNGKAHIRSRSDVPMAIGDAKRERIIRAALTKRGGENDEG